MAKLYNPKHSVCGTEMLIDIWQELVEYDFALNEKGEKVISDEHELTGDGGTREGYYCNHCDRYVEDEREIVQGSEIGELVDFPVASILNDLPREDLVDLLDAYDRYLEDARQNETFHDGWVPVCVQEFFQSDFKAWVR
jgi:hypothetical protein